MDSVIIEQKLESLRRCLQRIEKKCPSNPETLEMDPDLQDIIVLNLTRAIQLCVDIGAHIITDLDVSPPDTMGQTFDTLARTEMISDKLALQLKKAVGFRNIAIHNYEKINWIIVHTIARDYLDDFTEFFQVIASTLK